MQRSLIICRWIHLCLALMLVEFIAANCTFPIRKLPHGKIWFQEASDVHETTVPHNYFLQFKCDRGYIRMGPKFIICATDQWSDVVPTCTKLECSPPPEIENSTYTLHTGVNQQISIGSTVVYSCEDGYELLNETANILTCVLSQSADKISWEGEMPACKIKENCPDPGKSPDGSREGDCCISGSSLNFTCNEDYELVGPEEITCLNTGIWSSRRPLCKPLKNIHCPLPPEIPYGGAIGRKRKGDYYISHEEVEVLCEPGYSYDGYSPYILCLKTGQWEMKFGNCTESFCERPKPLGNGTITELQSTNQTIFAYSFELNYICDKGFRLIGGDSWRFCDSNGWSGKTPHCEVTKCPDPGVPDHGAREMDGFDVGSNVYFKCSSGYELIGSFERYCMPNGQWDGELARCDTEVNYCPDPGIPINGYRNSTNYDKGSFVGFGCRSGYNRLGSDTRVCQPNHMWSGVETTCIGPYDFDNSVEIRNSLIKAINAKADEQRRRLMPNHAKIVNVNYPGRLIFYFAFDVSGSVGPQNFNKSVEFAKAIVRKVGISEHGARAGALTFSSKSVIQFLPLDYITTEDVLDALDKLNYTGGATSASYALTQIREELIPLVEHKLEKKNQKSIVFILTDGKANMGGDPQVEANVLKKIGVEIYCIGITGDIKKSSLYDIASDSEKERHVFILKNYPTLSWLVQEITNGTIDYSQCGVGMEEAGKRIPVERILNGMKVAEPWPWMAALFFISPETYDPRGAKLQCGGSIIHKKFILTAAHCLYHEFEKDFKLREVQNIHVKLGLTDVKDRTFVQEPDVEAIYTHPNYKRRNFDYDIALIKLRNPIEYNAYIRPICLPPGDSSPNSKFYKENEYGLVSGWGHQGLLKEFEKAELNPSQHLKELIIPIQSKNRCNQSLGDNKDSTKEFTDQMFCAGNGQEGNDTCLGDSGGPFMQSQINQEGYRYWTQVGIVSWGVGCGQPNFYGFYTHVQILRKWIDKTIEEAMKEDLINT